MYRNVQLIRTCTWDISQEGPVTRNYSTSGFFRQMPIALLARHFASHEVLPDFDSAWMKETKVDLLFDAWMIQP